MGNALYRHPTKQTKDLLKDKEKFEKKMERWTVSRLGVWNVQLTVRYR